MTVASLEICKELYEASSWTNQHPGDPVVERAWRPTPLKSGSNYRLIGIGPNNHEDIPAYDLGFLIRRLPDQVRDEPHKDNCSLKLMKWRGSYIAEYHMTFSPPFVHTEADTPEDAMALAAIELFKRGLLQRDGDV